MAVIAAHLYVNDKLSPPLTGIYAAMPGGVNHQTVPEKYKDRFISLEQNADAPILSASSVDFIWSKLHNPFLHHCQINAAESLLTLLNRDISV